MRIREIGETDLLVTFFTPNKGQVKGIGKGARRSGKRFVNCLDLFSHVNLEYSIKKEGALYFLNSGKLINGFPGLRSDYFNLSKASFFIELTEVLFPPGVGDQRMFELLIHALNALSSGNRTDFIPLFFETKALSLGGFGLNLQQCCLCGRPYTYQGTAVYKKETGGIACLNCIRASKQAPPLSPEGVSLFTLIQSKPMAELLRLTIQTERLKELKPVLTLHREYHLERRLKTAKFVD